MASWFKGQRDGEPEDGTTPRSATTTTTAHNPTPPRSILKNGSSKTAAPAASPLPSQRQPQFSSPSSSSYSNNNNNNKNAFSTPTSAARDVRPELEWEEAHRQTCCELGMLAASTATVAAHVGSAYRVPAAPRGAADPATDPHYVVWNNNSNDNKKDDIAAFAQQKLRPRLLGAAAASAASSQNGASNSNDDNNYSFTSAVLAAPVKILSTVASPVLKVVSYLTEPECEYDQILQQQREVLAAEERRGAAATTTTTTNPEFPPDAVVVNVPLLSECHAYVSRILAQPPQQQLDASVESGVVVVSSLSEWIQEQQQQEQTRHYSNDAVAAAEATAQFLARLNAAHWDLLVECLIATSGGANATAATTIRKIPNRDPPLYAIVLRHHQTRSGPEVLDRNVEVAVTLHDLRRCMDQKEKVLALWQKQVDSLAQQAIAAKRQGEVARAKVLMQRRRHLLEQMVKEQSVLFNLETTAVSVESSVHQHATVQALRSAADALKQVRTSGGNATTVDDADDVVDDLTEQVEELNLAQDALGANFVNNNYLFDEDELMKELEALGDGDETKKSAATTESTTTATTLPTIQTQPTSESTVATNSSSYNNNNNTPTTAAATTTTAATASSNKNALSPASGGDPQPPPSKADPASKESGPPPKKKHQVLAGSSLCE